MDIEHFKKLLKGNNAIRINDEIIIFNNFELYSFDTEKSKYYRSLDELVNDNKEIKETILNTDDFKVIFDGGRGSGSNQKMGGGFSHSRDRGKGTLGKRLLNAELNFGTSKGNSIDSVLGRFQKKYGGADKEYGVAVDSRGYVHEHMSGGTSSVRVSGGKGMTIIHNHPSGGNFSDSDLLAVASTRNAGVIAISSNTKKKSTYRFEKTNKFKSNDFIKAVKKAQWPAHMSYDKGADWWLKKNSNQYGYKYTSTGVPKK